MEVYPYSVLIFVCILHYCFKLPGLFHVQASLVWVMNLVAEYLFSCYSSGERPHVELGICCGQALGTLATLAVGNMRLLAVSSLSGPRVSCAPVRKHGIFSVLSACHSTQKWQLHANPVSQQHLPSQHPQLWCYHCAEDWCRCPTTGDIPDLQHW